MSNQIGVVEDDRLIRDMIILQLKHFGYRANGFSSAESFLASSGDNVFDLVILDLVLPGMSGEKMLEELRKKEDDTPVLMLTVKSDLPTRIKALNTGADDYVVKPFNMDELMARISALIRRSQGKRRIPASQILVINGFKVDIKTRISESNIGDVTLSEKEIRLLRFLSRNIGHSISRADILEEVWGMDVAPTPRTIDNFILKFRKLFEDDPEEPKHFFSVRSKGYRFEE
ncbi:response regulator transcription factor [Acidobacteriota bacterium]